MCWSAEHSLAEIREAMMRKHVEMIEQAAASRSRFCVCRNCFTARISAPSRTPAGMSWRSRSPTARPSG